MTTAFADDRHPKRAQHCCADHWEEEGGEGEGERPLEDCAS